MLKTKELLQQLGKTRDNPKHPLEKIQILIDYIADNMENNEQDEERICEIVFAAKKNIAETIINLKEEAHVPLNDPVLRLSANDNGLGDAAAETQADMFMLDPETTITNMLEQQIQNGIEPNPIPEELNVTDEYRAHLTQLSAARAQEKLAKYRAASNLLKGKSYLYSYFERDNGAVGNDIINLHEEFPADAESPVEDALRENKGGFFERLFRTTSREYKTFERMLDQRKNGEASREDLEGSAVAYLRHRIRGYDGRGLPNLEDIERLSGTAKKKALLCYKTLKACQRSRTYEGKLGVISGVAENNLRSNGEYEAFQRQRHDNSMVIHGLDQLQQQSRNEQAVNSEEQQAEFQDNLANDIKESEHVGGMYDDEFSDESSIQYDDEEIDMNE